MAFQLKRALVTVSCHEDLTSSDLVGRFLLEGSSTPLLEMREDRIHLFAVQTQVGHADALVLGEERQTDRQ